MNEPKASHFKTRQESSFFQKCRAIASMENRLDDLDFHQSRQGPEPEEISKSRPIKYPKRKPDSVYRTNKTGQISEVVVGKYKIDDDVSRYFSMKEIEQRQSFEQFQYDYLALHDVEVQQRILEFKKEQKQRKDAELAEMNKKKRRMNILREPVKAIRDRNLTWLSRCKCIIIFIATGPLFLFVAMYTIKLLVFLWGIFLMLLKIVGWTTIILLTILIIYILYLYREEIKAWFQSKLFQKSQSKVLDIEASGGQGDPDSDYESVRSKEDDLRRERQESRERLISKAMEKKTARKNKEFVRKQIETQKSGGDSKVRDRLKKYREKQITGQENRRNLRNDESFIAGSTFRSTKNLNSNSNVLSRNDDTASTASVQIVSRENLLKIAKHGRKKPRQDTSRPDRKSKSLEKN